MKFLAKNWILILIVLFVAVVRVHLRDMPLERDEGEYAYAGQMMLKGEAPYKSAYNMKLPGTYAAYAAIMAVFGQTPSGIRIGVMLVNIASILLVFVIGRRLLDETTGLVAAGSFALLSLSPSVLGLSGHATHFVVLPALAGVLLLLMLAQKSEGGVQKGQPAGQTTGGADQPWYRGRHALALFSGLFMGLAFLMKQHGLFFGIFGFVYIGALHILAHREAALEFRQRTYKPPGAKGPAFPWRRLGLELSLFLGGFVLPYALTCLVLWIAGVFPAFWFWTVSYAAEYAKAIPLVEGPTMLKLMLGEVVGPNLLLWLLAAGGLIVMWNDQRLSLRAQVLVIALGLCAMGSVAVGLYFRGHYFIPLLPVLGLLGGLAVSRSLWLAKNDRSIGALMAVPILVALVGSIPLSVIGNGSVWFASPEAASKKIHHTTIFVEAAKVAEFLKQHTDPKARVAVIGSEPEIYFLSRRRSATGYIYMYPLMEKQPFAARMQEQMISEIETNRPEYVVYVGDRYSWLRSPHSDPRIFDWWTSYWEKNLDLVNVAKVETNPEGDAELQTLDSKVSNRITPGRGPKVLESEIMVLKSKN